MTQFKSYAKGGNFATYHIDLPIQQEINEDLRAAKGFAADMRVSQQYREKWAKSYLTSLNNKFSEERQNRDDNIEFTLDNHKRIFEGEQREFAGRLQQLQTEQAQRAADAAEPSLLEKLTPLLIQAGTMAMGMIAETNAANLKANVEGAEQASMALAATGSDSNIGKMYEAHAAATTDQARQALEDAFVASDAGKFLTDTGQDARKAYQSTVIGSSHMMRARSEIQTNALVGRISQTLQAEIADGTISTRGGDQIQYRQTIVQRAQQLFNEGRNPETASDVTLNAWKSINKDINAHIGQSQAHFKAQTEQNQANLHAGAIAIAKNLSANSGTSYGQALNKNLFPILLTEQSNNPTPWLEATKVYTSILTKSESVTAADMREAYEDWTKTHPSLQPEIKGPIADVWRASIREKGNIEHNAKTAANTRRAAAEQEIVKNFEKRFYEIEKTDGYVGARIHAESFIGSNDFTRLSRESQNQITKQLHSRTIAAKERTATEAAESGLTDTQWRKLAKNQIDQNLQGSKAWEKGQLDPLSAPAGELAEVAKVLLGTKDFQDRYPNLRGIPLMKVALQEAHKTLVDQKELLYDNFDPTTGKAKDPAKPITVRLPLQGPSNAKDPKQFEANMKNKIKENGIDATLNTFQPISDHDISSYRSIVNTLSYITGRPITRNDLLAFKDIGQVRRLVAAAKANGVNMDWTEVAARQAKALLGDSMTIDMSTGVLTLQEQLEYKDTSMYTPQLSKSFDSSVGTDILQGVRARVRAPRGGTLQPEDHFEHGKQGVKNAQGVFRNQEVADSAAMIAKAYPDMTWTSTQRTPEYQEDMKRRGYSPSDTSNHLHGESFDAVGEDVQRLKQDIDSGVVQGVSYYIGPGYSHVHFDITGPVSINGVQLQQLEPMVQPLTENMPDMVPVNPDNNEKEGDAVVKIVEGLFKFLKGEEK